MHGFTKQLFDINGTEEAMSVSKVELWELAQCGMSSALCEAGDGTLCEESES